MGRGNVLAVQDGSRDLPGGPGQVGGLSLRSGMGRWTVPEVRDRSGTLPKV